MNEHGMTAENILASLPPIFASDPQMMALIESICDVLASRTDEIIGVQIYSRIDSLPENLLDIVAKDFKVDWWDVNYTLEEKRATLKDNWRVHRMLGTPAAVITAISAIYPNTRIEEWWEYNGKPFHFRIVIDATYENADPEKHARVMDRVRYYKNLRSYLDDVEYMDFGGRATQYFGAIVTGEMLEESATAY